MDQNVRFMAGLALQAGGCGAGAQRDGGGGGGEEQAAVGVGTERQLQQQRQQQQHHQEDDGSDVVMFSRLPTGPFLRVLEFLPAQDRACSGRLACRDAWWHLSGVHHRTAYLSQPLPPHAVPWFERYGSEALKQLPHREKLTQPMSAAAASGSTANLAAVWGLVRQGLHPELLQAGHYSFASRFGSVGAVLVRDGHAHLLPWLLDNGHPVDAQAALLRAAQYCNLAGLQAVWQLLRPDRQLINDALAFAARSISTDDAIAKMEWLLQQHGETGGANRLPPRAAAAAAGTGDLSRLQWMLQRGCDFYYYEGIDNGLDTSGRLLTIALSHAGLEVVEWLVREAGCRLPDPAPGPAAAAAAAAAAGEGKDRSYRLKLVAAAAASGSVTKLQWLRDRGLLSLPPADMQDVLYATTEGQLETLRFLHQDFGVQLSEGLARAAVQSGEVASASWMMQQGGRGLFADRGSVWRAAAASGSVGMVRWLVGEGMGGAGRVEVTLLVKAWPSETQQDRASLLPAVQLAVQSVGNQSGSSGGSNGVRDGGADGGGGGLAPEPPPSGQQQCQELLVAVARRGDLPLLAYLHSLLQCPLGPEVLLAAVGCGCEALVEWLLGHGCALPEDTVALLMEPMKAGDLAMVRCLLRMGVPIPRGMQPEAATRRCPLPMLRWLVAEGAPAVGGEVAPAMGG